MKDNLGWEVLLTFLEIINSFPLMPFSEMMKLLHCRNGMTERMMNAHYNHSTTQIILECAEQQVQILLDLTLPISQGNE